MARFHNTNNEGRQKGGFGERFQSLPKSIRIFGVLFLLFLLLSAGALSFFYFGPLGKIDYTTLPLSDDDGESLKEGEGGTSDTDRENFQDLDNSEIDQVPEKLIGMTQSDKNIENIVFFGLDVRKEGSDSGRSDVIMILSIDHVGKKIRAASILRDCYVKIPGHGKNRINAAYAFGGPALAINTINLNFDTDIQKYVKVDFFGMAKIINTLGGVIIPELSEAEAGQIRKTARGGSDVKAGKRIPLNGEEAVAYARIRYIDNDFYRTERQRNVVKQLTLKVFGMNLKKDLSLLDDILPNLETNLTRSEILSIGWRVLTSGYDKDIEELCIPVDDEYQYANINGAAVILPDIGQNVKALKEFLYEAKT